MQLIVDRHGTVHAIYGEALDLAALGELTIRRASWVEPDAQGRWWADLAPVGGPHLGPYARRSEALDAERIWLEQHWLIPTAPPGEVAVWQRLIAGSALRPGSQVQRDVRVAPFSLRLVILRFPRKEQAP